MFSLFVDSSFQFSFWVFYNASLYCVCDTDTDCETQHPEIATAIQDEEAQSVLVELFFLYLANK